jgi:hypothetical protein
VYGADLDGYILTCLQAHKDHGVRNGAYIPLVGHLVNNVQCLEKCDFEAGLIHLML